METAQRLLWFSSLGFVLHCAEAWRPVCVPRELKLMLWATDGAAGKNFCSPSLLSPRKITLHFQNEKQGLCCCWGSLLERGRDETKGTLSVLMDTLQMGLILFSCLSFSLIQICPSIFPSTHTQQQPCSCPSLPLAQGPSGSPWHSSSLCSQRQEEQSQTLDMVHGVPQAPSLLLHAQRESICKCFNSNLWTRVFLCEWRVWEPLQGDGDPDRTSGSLF